MKNKVIILVLLITSIVYAQKKNGTVYNEHPAIKIVEDFQQAWVKGDADKAATYLADNFKSFNGTSTNRSATGTDKEQFLEWTKNRANQVSYSTLVRDGQAYPDAIEYKDDGVWVQTWDYIKSIHNDTGIKIEMPVHSLYKLNKDNKIETAINYNYNIGRDIRDAYSIRTNGVIYNEHPNINTVRKMVAALENGDPDTGFSYFTDDAQFSNLDMPWGETNGLADEKAHFKEFMESFTLDGFDVVGYPDYFEYEIGNGKTVQSWWVANITRKSDSKKFKLPMMFIHDFNDEGKINREIGYYTTSSLMAK